MVWQVFAAEAVKEAGKSGGTAIVPQTSKSGDAIATQFGSGNVTFGGKKNPWLLGGGIAAAAIVLAVALWPRNGRG